MDLSLREVVRVQGDDICGIPSTMPGTQQELVSVGFISTILVARQTQATSLRSWNFSQDLCWGLQRRQSLLPAFINLINRQSQDIGLGLAQGPRQEGSKDRAAWPV